MGETGFMWDALCWVETTKFVLNFTDIGKVVGSLEGRCRRQTPLQNAKLAATEGAGLSCWLTLIATLWLLKGSR